MSTSDTAIVLANGRAGNEPIAAEGEGAEAFAGAVRDICIELAQMLVRDGEGATKLVTIAVGGAQSDDDARRAARTIANSILFKMALLGEDPNWGRIAAALGTAGVEVRPEACSIGFNGIHVLDRGRIVPRDEAQLGAVMKKPEFQIDVDLGTGGTGRATFWTCDISEAYIKFNAHYRT
jgi:glutamate N-acetyltransferase/amino-acid N-acetyltransferase